MTEAKTKEGEELKEDTTGLTMKVFTGKISLTDAILALYESIPEQEKNGTES